MVLLLASLLAYCRKASLTERKRDKIGRPPGYTGRLQATNCARDRRSDPCFEQSKVCTRNQQDGRGGLCRRLFAKLVSETSSAIYPARSHSNSRLCIHRISSNGSCHRLPVRRLRLLAQTVRRCRQRGVTSRHTSHVNRRELSHFLCRSKGKFADINVHTAEARYIVFCFEEPNTAQKTKKTKNYLCNDEFHKMTFNPPPPSPFRGMMHDVSLVRA